MVVHLAFLITSGSRETTRAINVEGTLNAFRAAADAGVERFVYASSVAAYGFHRDNPIGMSEDWATRPADRLFYAQEKAELEHLLHARRPPRTRRPRSTCCGPRSCSAPTRSEPRPASPRCSHPWRTAAGAALWHLPGLPALVPDLPLQVIHQDDVAEALRLCVVGAGAPGAYNIAADDVVTLVDIARELGLRPVRLPGGPVAALARGVARLPYLPSRAQWVEAFSHPAIMDTTKARTELGWRPQHTAIESLRSTFR